MSKKCSTVNDKVNHKKAALYIKGGKAFSRKEWKGKLRTEEPEAWTAQDQRLERKHQEETIFPGVSPQGPLRLG